MCYKMVELAHKRKYKRLTPDVRRAVISRLKAGGTVQSVSETMEVSIHAVKKIKSNNVYDGDGITTKYSEVLRTRVSKVELSEFNHLATKHGFRSSSDMLRFLIRRAAGFLEFEQTAGQELEVLNQNLLTVYKNVNQIAKAANSYKVELMNSQWSEIRQLQNGIRHLKDYLSKVTDENRREGAVLFKKYAEANRD